MKHSRKQNEKAREAYDLYWESYLIGDVKTLSSLLDNQYTQVGSVESEVFFNKKDAVKFVVDTIDQIVGLLEMRNREIRSEAVGEFILFHEQCDLYVLSEKDWVFYSKFRASSLMKEEKEGWKLIHQHSSLPDSKAEEGDNIATEKITEENLQLKEAIKRRTVELENKTNELEIEGALERIRARSMAMQQSTELQEVAYLLFQELKKLGGDFWGAGIGLCSDNRKEDEFWFAYEKGMLPPVSIPNDVDPAHKRLYEAWLEKRKYLAIVKEGKELEAHYDYMLSIPSVNPFFKNILESGLSFPTWQTWHAAYFSHGYLLSITLEEYPNSQIFERFAKVFDQAFTRFLDLQKAEAQVKEAQIEAALEKVRSRSLAMHKSDELNEVVSIVFEKLKELQIPATAVGLGIPIDGSKDLNSYVCGENEDGLVVTNYRLPYFDNPIPKDLYNTLEKQLDFFEGHYSKAEKDSFYNYVIEHTPEFRHLPKDILSMIFDSPTYTISLVAVKNAVFNINDFEGKILAENEIDIIKRFALVFDQAYTRFLDLQKAEAQAREGQIELSLERIRAQVTAMRQSDELFDIVVAMRKEFISLGHEADYFWHMKWTPENYQMSMTSEDGERVGMIISVPKFVHDEIPRLAEWEKSDSPIIALDLNGTEAWDYVDKMNTYGKYEQADPHAPTEEDIMAIGGLTFVIARTTHGEIGFSLAGQVPNPPQESTETLIRFAGVFDLAYRRFEDLLTAEKQNRKAKIELALERVRARALAMQEPEELVEVAQVMREEMGLLGVEELETSSIYINKNTAGGAECWYSIKDIRDGEKTYVADHFDLNYQETWVGRQMLNFYRGEKLKASIVMKGVDRIEWINYCANQSPKLDGYYGTEIPERTYHLTKFSNGAIGAATPGEISTESWDLLSRAASVFSLAYSRFRDLSKAREDLKKLKKAKARAEKALSELKSAQEQLVQQEKLASLGQLTAGIAHEIKNPLNFVNNFSDLSRELIEEVFEELENVKDSDAKEEIIAILNDVRSNLSKVHEHGSRADSIVTSMLQHSRASGSKREAKEFNPLVKEYVNLSFHGMRAGKNPINVDIDFQLDEKVGMVNLVSEDFSRVIVNLCNNAFDAMRSKTNSELYKPKLTVSTKTEKNLILIEVVDNGLGIPDEIKDKILQPFFTTKKGTEGTGLGLSITHDIIKAHGGELKVESSLEKGSIFSIQLPIQ